MISVCIATYNGARFIEEQLRSILPQLNDDDEVLISDDGSTDGTLDIVSSIEDARIKIVGHGGNLGIVRNFERALWAAQGGIIFLSDQDDVWLPDKVATCVSALDAHLMVVTDCKVVDADLRELSSSFFRLRKSGPGVIHNLIRNSYLGCCMAFRQELMAYALPFPNGIAMHDIWLGLIADCRRKVKFIPQPQLLYRRHGANASATAEKSKFSLYWKLNYRLVLFFHLISRMSSIFLKSKLG